MVNNWLRIWEEHSGTFAVAAFFSAMSAAFLIKAREKATPVTVGNTFLAFLSGQMVTAASVIILVKVLKWDEGWAIAVGVLGGVLGYFVLMTLIKVATRVEQRGDELGDTVADHIKHKGGGT
jgi:hypothetical protein